MIEDDVAVEQHVAVVEHQGGHAGERIVGADLVGIGEGRPGTVLERQAVEHERDADAADEGRVVLADEDHGSCPELLGKFFGGIGSRQRELTKRVAGYFLLCDSAIISSSTVRATESGLEAAAPSFVAFCRPPYLQE
jgi:hypothetical protein